MKLEIRHKYTASSSDVYALFTSKNFHKKKFKACGARNIKVIDKKKSTAEFSIKVEREMPADVPGVLKSFLGDWNSVTQIEEWQDVDDGEYICDFTIDADSVPVEFTGTMNLMPEGDGCVNYVVLDIECGIPFVGKKLVQFVAKDAKKSLQAEYKYIRSQLE